MTRIAKLKFTDVLGIEELEFTAGQWNEIVGGNGTGKTSLLEGLKSLFGGGYDAQLIRKGADRAEMVAVLDNGMTMRKRIGKGQGLTIEQDGVRQDKKTQTTVDGMLDMMSVNPVAFLQAKPDKRASVLLETMPISADVERVREILGQPSYELADGQAIDQLRGVYDEVFQQRRDTNRAVKDKESAIEQLAATLPPQDQVPAGGEAEIEASIAELDAAKEAEDQRIDNKLGTLKREHEAEVETIQQEIGVLREEIARLQGQIAEKQETIATKKAGFEETRGRANGQRERKTAEWRSARQPHVTQLEVIKANRDAHTRAALTRENIARMRTEADGLTTDSERQTKILEDLQAYKSELLATLPIPGLEVKDGELYRDGVPFERLNKAQQARIAIEVAKLRAGELRVVCVDEFESLEASMRDEVLRLAEEADLQFFVTRVADDGAPLAINAQ